MGLCVDKYIPQEVRGQGVEGNALLLPHGSWWLYSHLAWQQVALSNELFNSLTGNYKILFERY